MPSSFRVRQAVNHVLLPPGVAVGIAEGHGEISHHAQAGSRSLGAYVLQRLARLLQCLSLVALKKCGGDGIGKPQGANRSGANGPLRALLVDHDAR